MHSLTKLLARAGFMLIVTACSTARTPVAIPSPSSVSSPVPQLATEKPQATATPPEPVATATPEIPVSTQTVAPTPVPTVSPIRGVFEGITPCSPLTRPLPQIPADANCELMRWMFVLFQDPATGVPTT